MLDEFSLSRDETYRVLPDKEREMSQWDKLLRRILGGRADANIAFGDLRGLLARLGYNEHIKGDHHIFRKAGQPEIIDLQPQRDGKAKAYQIRQLRAIFRKYGITQLS